MTNSHFIQDLRLIWKPIALTSIFCLVIDLVFIGIGSWHVQIPHLLCAVAAVLFSIPGDPQLFLVRGAIALVPASASLGFFSWYFNHPGIFLAGILGHLGAFGIIFLHAQYQMDSLVSTEKLISLEEDLQKERDNTLQLVLHFSLLGCMSYKERVFQQAMHILKTFFHFQQASLYLANPSESELYPAKTIGFPSDKLTGLTIKTPPDFWQKNIPDPEEGILGIISGPSRLPPRKELIPTCGLDSMGALPLAINGRIIGLLNFVKQHPDGKRHLQNALLATFAHVLGSALFNCKVHESNLMAIDNANRQREEITKTFSRFVAPAVIKQMEERPETMELGGKRMIISTLMADLRGFTALSSSLPLESTCYLLNDWLTQATRIIFQQQGTLDKFLGDGIMVLFGAPLPGQNDPQKAVETGRMLQRLFSIFVSKQHKLLEGHTLGLGIGVATGDAIVGNFGASDRMDYTAIGDSVNLAARLEKLAKPGEIIVDETTFNCLPKSISSVTLRDVPIKGQAPQTIFKLKS